MNKKEALKAMIDGKTVLMNHPSMQIWAVEFIFDGERFRPKESVMQYHGKLPEGDLYDLLPERITITKQDLARAWDSINPIQNSFHTSSRSNTFKDLTIMLGFKE